MHYTYTTSGTCSRSINFDMDENSTVSNVSFVNGCNGNLKAISILTEGMPAADIIHKLEGLTCKSKPTSCGDQFACALKQALSGSLPQAEVAQNS